KVMRAISTPDQLPKARPQVRRLPGRKRMTIAIGLLATDGVVIAADTQESAGYPGDMKSSGTKILWALRSNASNPPVTGAFAVSGAGTVGYLDAVNQKLENHSVYLPEIRLMISRHCLMRHLMIFIRTMSCCRKNVKISILILFWGLRRDMTLDYGSAIRPFGVDLTTRVL